MTVKEFVDWWSAIFCVVAFTSIFCICIWSLIKAFKDGHK